MRADRFSRWRISPWNAETRPRGEKNEVRSMSLNLWGTRRGWLSTGLSMQVRHGRSLLLYCFSHRCTLSREDKSAESRELTVCACVPLANGRRRKNTILIDWAIRNGIIHHYPSEILTKTSVLVEVYSKAVRHMRWNGDFDNDSFPSEVKVLCCGLSGIVLEMDGESKYSLFHLLVSCIAIDINKTNTR